MNPQERLSPRVRAVIDALNHVQKMRTDWIDAEPVDFHLFEHKETKEVGVFIPQGDDPEDALMLDDNGLKGMQEGSMYLPWDDDDEICCGGQGEAFFAAVITAFMCHEEILQPPVCEQCEEAKREMVGG